MIAAVAGGNSPNKNLGTTGGVATDPAVSESSCDNVPLGDLLLIKRAAITDLQPTPENAGNFCSDSEHSRDEDENAEELKAVSSKKSRRRRSWKNLGTGATTRSKSRDAGERGNSSQ